LGRLLGDEPSGQYLVTKSTLSPEEHAELQSLAAEAHNRFRNELEDAIARLRKLLGRGDPLRIAAMIQFFNLFGAWGSYYEPTHQGSEPKVELVCGLLVSQPPAQDVDGPTTAEIQEIFTTVEAISELLFLVNVSRSAPGAGQAEMLRFMGAMHWMYMRGPSYGAHGEELARSLYEPHDDWLLREYGFSFQDMVSVGHAVEALVNERMNHVLDRGREFAGGIVAGLRKPDVRSQLPTGFLNWARTKAGRDQVVAKAMFYALEVGSREALTFSVDELSERMPSVPREKIDSVLKELSLSVGGLEPARYRGLFDESPFVSHPFMEFAGRYLLVIPGMLLRDTVDVLEDRFMEGRGGFSRARALVLDRLAVEYLAKLLPGGLVLFEDIAFVVEGKGTGLSVQGHRGDTIRLSRDIARAVEEAWRQGVRAREYLLRDQEAVFRRPDGGVVRLPARSVREVWIVNPTLHELAGHAPQLARLRSLGLFAEGELPWSVFINDLRVISETSSNPAVFLHYLVWRNRLPLGERIMAIDEIDIWASYLLGERFGMLADATPGMMVTMGNSSTDFDDYYNGMLGHGPKRVPPQKFLEEPVTSFVERMSAERPPGWREAAGVCLDLSIPELGAVCIESKNVANASQRLNARVVVPIGRVALIGLPPRSEVESTSALDIGEAVLIIYCRNHNGTTEIAWAHYAGKVSFELSDFEKAVFNSPKASPFASVRAQGRGRSGPR
jgi:hypothetical protein